MRMRILAAVDGTIAALWGALFMLWPGPMMPLYGVEQSLDTLALTRVFGAALVGFGLAIWAVRGVLETPAGVAAVRWLLAAHLVGLAIALIQQGAIWNSLTGGAMVAFYFFFSGVYAWAALRRDPPRPADADRRSTVTVGGGEDF